MTTARRHPLVEEYLRDLERRAARLPSRDRVELLADVRTHVDAAAAEASSEADVRNLLQSLGTPEEVVDASSPLPASTQPTGRLALTVGVIALVLVPFLAFFAVPVGIVAVFLGVRTHKQLRSAGAPTATATAAVFAGGLAVAIAVLFSIYITPTTIEMETPEPEPELDIAPTTTGGG